CLRVLRRPPAGSPSVRRSSRPGGRAPRNPHAPVPLSRLRARFEHLPLGTCSRARWLHGCPRARLAARRGTWVAWLPLAGVGCMAAPVLALRLVGARGFHGLFGWGLLRPRSSGGGGWGDWNWDDGNDRFEPAEVGGIGGE